MRVKRPVRIMIAWRRQLVVGNSVLSQSTSELTVGDHCAGSQKQYASDHTVSDYPAKVSWEVACTDVSSSMKKDKQRPSQSGINASDVCIKSTDE